MRININASTYDNTSYRVGQIINIGYYGGFHNRERILTQAEIIKVSDATGLITIRVYLRPGGYREMFGYAGGLQELEDNYREWSSEK